MIKQLAEVDFDTFYKTNEYVAKTTPMRTHYESQNPLERWIWQKKKKIIEEFLESIRYESVIDVGCGDGGLYDLIDSEAEYTGVDISPTQLNAFRRYRLDKQARKPKLIEADVMNLPSENNRFDLALACDVLEHVLDPGKVIAEIKRVVKIKGYAIISIPNESLFQLARLLTGRFPLRSPDHLYALSIQDIEREFSRVTKHKGIPFTLFPKVSLLNILLIRNE